MGEGERVGKRKQRMTQAPSRDSMTMYPNKSKTSMRDTVQAHEIMTAFRKRKKGNR